MPAQYDVPATWGTNPHQELDLPSGHKILVKPIDLQAIVAADLLDEFDKLSPVVDDQVVKPAQGKRPADRPKKKPSKAEREAAAMREFFSKDNIETLTTLLDRMLPQIVIQPKIQSSLLKDQSGKWCKLDHEDREEGVIYVDTIPFADQMHILEFGMNGLDMRGLQRFREQPEQDVVSMEAVETPPDPSE